MFSRGTNTNSSSRIKTEQLTKDLHYVIAGAITGALLALALLIVVTPFLVNFINPEAISATDSHLMQGTKLVFNLLREA